MFENSTSGFFAFVLASALVKRFMVALRFILAILGLVAPVHPNFDDHQHEEFAKIGPVTARVDKPERATLPPVVAAVLLITVRGTNRSGSKNEKVAANLLRPTHSWPPPSNAQSTTYLFAAGSSLTSTPWRLT